MTRAFGLTVVLIASLPAQAYAAPLSADDRPVPFGDDTAWIAIRGRSQQQIAAALKLSNLRRATWKDGLAAANAGGEARTVFLTPDVHGWTLVVGAGFLSRVESRPPEFHDLIAELSAKLDTEVQFFAQKNLAGETLCAWARAAGGTRLRAFSCFQNRQRAVDVGPAAGVDALNVECARGEVVCGVDVAEVAGSWSIDPFPVHANVRADARIPAVVPRGFLAELPKDVPRKVAARPRLVPPDWVREAAARVERPAAALDAACTQGDSAACADRALLLLASPQATRALPRAAALATRACEGGSVLACALHGWMMRRGFGLDEDRSAAQELLERACDGGHAPGCFLLGVSLQRGEAGAPARSRAWDGFERSCSGGYAPACSFTRGVGAREGSPAGLSPMAACKGQRILTTGIDPGPLLALLERVREHQPLGEAVRDLARWQARLLRNAVFASRGRTFEARDLRAFFAGLSWYAPASGEVNDRLTAADRRNVTLLQEREACTSSDDYRDEDMGDWRLVEIHLAEEEVPLSARAEALIGLWETCHAVPAEGCPTLAFFSNGRVVYGPRTRARIGTWRLQGRAVVVRYFAELRKVGAGFSPAEPGDENDEEPSPGVPKLFAIDAVEQAYDLPSGAPDEELTSPGTDLGVKRSGDPWEPGW